MDVMAAYDLPLALERFMDFFLWVLKVLYTLMEVRRQTVWFRVTKTLIIVDSAAL